MKNKYFDFAEEDEIELLSEQLDSRDMFIVGFLKGFDRRTMKGLAKKGLWDISIDDYNID